MTEHVSTRRRRDVARMQRDDPKSPAGAVERRDVRASAAASGHPPLPTFQAAIGETNRSYGPGEFGAEVFLRPALRPRGQVSVGVEFDDDAPVEQGRRFPKTRWPRALVRLRFSAPARGRRLRYGNPNRTLCGDRDRGPRRQSEGCSLSRGRSARRPPPCPRPGRPRGCLQAPTAKTFSGRRRAAIQGQ